MTNINPFRNSFVIRDQNSDAKRRREISDNSHSFGTQTTAKRENTLHTFVGKTEKSNIRNSDTTHTNLVQLNCTKIQRIWQGEKSQSIVAAFVTRHKNKTALR
jgi:hypothetical protein